MHGANPKVADPLIWYSSVMQGDKVEILIMTKEGTRREELQLKLD